MPVGRYAASLTCALDGLAHVVSDDAAVAGLVAGRGIYTALCGHAVHAAAMICAAGQPCPRCAQQVEASLAAADTTGHRRTWLRRLWRRTRARDRPASPAPALPDDGSG